MNILITICARGGSKGIPNKNIKLLNGIPLIAYTIKTGLQFVEKYNADFSLSTDSEEIQTVAAKYGLLSNYQRPIELASDTAGKISVIKHLMDFEEKGRRKHYDFIVDMDVTSPLRNLNDLECAFNQLQKHNDALNIFSVSPANRNPYFNMVEMMDNGYVRVVKNFGEIKSRQDAPKVFDMNASFYIFKKDFFKEGWEITTTDRSLAYIVPHICFDIDNPIDFIFMEILLKKRLLDFEL